MVKIQRTQRGNYLISLPKKYLMHCGWKEGTELNICATENGLRLVALRSGSQ